MLGMRKGSWTPEEDDKLVNYIKLHGPGRWDYLAKRAGLERNGKSCRLRWLNHLRPDLRHDDFTLEEQLRILELQSQWGNRWSKIAENLPGRTDNEIKNYWRTRVQKRAKDLNYDADSLQFKHVMLNSWMPRLAEQIQTTFGYDDISTESSTIMNSIHGPLSIKDVGEIHFGHTTSRNTLENKVQTSRPETHGSSHMWDNFPSSNEQSQLESGYGSQCSMIQMDPYQPPHSNTGPTHFFCGNIQEPDNGPFNLNHFNPHVWLPSLNLLSYSSLSLTDHLSAAASELGHNPTGYPEGFLLAQNDDCLNESTIGSVSGLEFLCDGGIFGHEVKNVLANF